MGNIFSHQRSEYILPFFYQHRELDPPAYSASDSLFHLSLHDHKSMAEDLALMVPGGGESDEPTSLSSIFGIEKGNGSASSLFRPPIEITSTAKNMDSWSSAFTKAWWDRGPESVLAAVGLCYGLVLALSQDRSFWLSSSIPRDFLPSLWFGIIVNTITGKVARRNKATAGRKYEDMVDRITVCLLVVIIALFNSAMMFIASRWG